MASLPFQGFRSAPQHVHISGERCPWCDQAIPHDKFDEISNRIAAREREQLAIITKDLKDQFAREKAEIEAKAAAAAGARLQAKLAEIERANSAAVGEVQAQLGEAERARGEAERAAETLRAAQEARLGELREALEKQRTAAVLAEQAKSFEERQKLHEKVQELQRQLENKTAQELGEGAEIDLLDELKAHFEGDRFSHVGKGAQGADIIHEVVHNGKVCGKIIYDAKNPDAGARASRGKGAPAHVGAPGETDPVGAQGPRRPLLRDRAHHWHGAGGAAGRFDLEYLPPTRSG